MRSTRVATAVALCCTVLSLLNSACSRQTPAGTVKISKPFGTCDKSGQSKVPTTLEGAMGQLKRLLGPAQVARFKRDNPMRYHHGLGTALRNCWGLWSGSALASWFRKQGAKHPDDMSGIILTSFHRRLNGKPIDLEGQVARYRAYWKKRDDDYKKGTASGNVSFDVVKFEKKRGWVSLIGHKVPRIYDLILPLIAHAKGGIETCWNRFPKTPGNAAVETSIKIVISKDGKLIEASVVKTAIPANHAACIAKALVGASIPKHAGASFTVVIQSYRA